MTPKAWKSSVSRPSRWCSSCLVSCVLGLTSCRDQSSGNSGLYLRSNVASSRKRAGTVEKSALDRRFATVAAAEASHSMKKVRAWGSSSTISSRFVVHEKPLNRSRALLFIARISRRGSNTIAPASSQESSSTNSSAGTGRDVRFSSSLQATPASEYRCFCSSTVSLSVRDSAARMDSEGCSSRPCSILR